MVKKIIVICIILFGVNSYAQSGTASPYSFYGIGSLKFKGTVENQSMGDMSVYMDSIHINLKNPAAYVGKNIEAFPYDNESRPVKFAVAATSSNLNLESNTTSQSASSSTFDYIAVSVPIGDFGFGFGLLPFTSVGYKLDDISANNTLNNRYQGEGGVNRVFAGLGYKLTNKINIGLDFNYNFGNTQNSAITFAYTPEGNLVEYQTREDNRSDISGVSLNFGIAYKTMISDHLELSTTATYSPQSNWASTNQRSYSSILYNSLTEAEVVRNTIEVDLANATDQNGNPVDLENTDLTIPSRLSLGVGVGKSKSWFLGAEYTLQNTSAFSNPIFSNQASSFENASQISLGGFYIPNYNAFSGYFKRIVYRAGLNFGNTGLVIKNESIKEFGMSFGLGLPIGNRNLFSNLNLGVELGQRGTTNQNLIQENFINLNVSLSLNSRWFRKKKYN